MSCNILLHDTTLFRSLGVMQPPARLFLRRLTAQSTSASSGTPSSTAKGVISTGILYPGGGTRMYSVTRSAIIRLSVARAGRRRSAVHCCLVPPLKAVPRLLDEGRVRLHQRFHLRPRFVRPPSLVCCQALLYRLSPQKILYSYLLTSRTVL